MTGEDIKRIVICREAIDKHRAFNRARVEALATSTSVADAKTIIEAKIGATTIAVDTSIKPTQEIKSVLEEERTKSTLEMNKVLKEQGFDDYPTFRDWYNKIIFEIYKEYHPMRGSCDWCGEKEYGSQPCVKLYTVDTACGREKPQSVTDRVYKEALKRELSGIVREEKGIILPISPCLGEGGFYNIPEDYKEIPSGIDFRWKP